MRAFVFFFLVSNIFSTLLTAQEERVKWGEVSDDDLQMTSYHPDPDADAVVLCDYGTISVELWGDDVKYRFHRLRRIKILNKHGFAQSNIQIPYISNKKNPEKITLLKAQTHTPDGRKIPIKNKNVAEESINSYWSAQTFTFPEIEEGAILEYRYEILSGRIVELRDWYFQDSIPVRISELKVEIPSWFNYVYFFQGGGSIEQETADVNKKFDFHGNQVAKLKTNFYRMTNVPALKEEAFITTMDDYRSRLTFQLQEIQYPSGLSRTFMSDWNSLAKELMADEEFGLQLTKKKYIKILAGSEASEIIKSNLTAKEKANQLYQFVNSILTFKKAYSVFTAEKLDEVYLRKSGTAGQGNLMLLALLKLADIEAWPLLVSTRSNGRMVQLYPILDQFNHVMIYSKIDGESIIMDVGDPHRPINLPRIDALNEMGWVVSEENPRWITIKPSVSRDVIMADFKLKANGELSGLFSCSHEGYSAVKKRSLSKGSDKNLILKNQLKNIFPTLQVDSFYYSGLSDFNHAFKLYTYCDIPGAARMEGNRLFLKPVLISRFNENPLIRDKRTYPVNIPYPLKENYILNLSIPEGFEVEKLPDPIHLVLPSQGAQFHYLIKQKGQQIHLINKINIQQLKYPSNEYGAIKSLFDMIAEKQLEEIVFRKSEG